MTNNNTEALSRGLDAELAVMMAKIMHTVRPIGEPPYTLDEWCNGIKDLFAAHAPTPTDRQHEAERLLDPDLIRIVSVALMRNQYAGMKPEDAEFCANQDWKQERFIAETAITAIKSFMESGK